MDEDRASEKNTKNRHVAVAWDADQRLMRILCVNGIMQHMTLRAECNTPFWGIRER